VVVLFLVLPRHLLHLALQDQVFYYTCYAFELVRPSRRPP